MAKKKKTPKKKSVSRVRLIGTWTVFRDIVDESHVRFMVQDRRGGEYRSVYSAPTYFPEEDTLVDALMLALAHRLDKKALPINGAMSPPKTIRLAFEAEDLIERMETFVSLLTPAPEIKTPATLARCRARMKLEACDAWEEHVFERLPLLARGADLDRAEEFFESLYYGSPYLSLYFPKDVLLVAGYAWLFHPEDDEDSFEAQDALTAKFGLRTDEVALASQWITTVVGRELDASEIAEEH